MDTRTTAKTIGLLAAMLATVTTGCERAVVGETYANQIHGDRALEVTYDSPPAGATSGDHVPRERPTYEWSPSIRDGNDPAVRGMLLASGARFPEPPATRRPVAPTPVPLPIQILPAAPPAGPAAPAPAVAPVIEGPAHPVHGGLAPAPVARVVRPAPAPAAPAPAAPAPAAP